jgi:Sensors of blue-light using FAD
MLLYHDGNFMQALEGSEAGVLALAGSIAGDPRHKDMQVVVRYATDAREFGEWDMAFHQLVANDAETRDFVDLTRDRARLERELGKGGIARIWLDRFRRNAR